MNSEASMTAGSSPRKKTIRPLRMQLHIKPVWIDDDGLMQVRVSVDGNERQSWGEAYCYPEAVSEFGQALIDFPSSISDEVKLELGSMDPTYADYLLVRAFVYDGAGHCAIEFRAESRGDAITSSSVRFAVPTEAASLNEMGRRIMAWSLSPTEPFAFEGAGQ
ncbi:hypothetical protein [Ralstonia wenshanensis]|nr:hypothetical protein [Ralstonia wenshanensis]